MKTHTYRGQLITKNEVGYYRVRNAYSFKTLGKAMDFIDRMATEWGL